MRTFVLLMVALALLAPMATAQTTTDPTAPPTDPSAPPADATPTDPGTTPTDPGAGTDTTPDTTTDSSGGTTTNDNDVTINNPPARGESDTTTYAAPFGMAWWAWLLIALIVVGVIAAIAVAMGSRADRTTVIDREYRGPPPP